MKQMSLFASPRKPKPRRYPDAAGFKDAGGCSEEAAKAVDRRLSENMARVLDGFRRHGPHTPDEMAELLGMNVLYFRPRCSQLLDWNYLRRTGVRRKNKSGMNAHELEACR